MLRRPASSASRMLTVAVVVAAVTAALSACGSEDRPDRAIASASALPEETPTSSSSATGEAPSYVADGTAEDNLPLFAATTARVWASDQRGSGRAYVDALVEAGFDRDAMQVTEDVTTVGEPVESLQFSVLWGDAECLIGQVGPSTGDPVAIVMPQLAERRCLVGTTRPIDW